MGDAIFSLISESQNFPLISVTCLVFNKATNSESDQMKFTHNIFVFTPVFYHL